MICRIPTMKSAFLKTLCGHIAVRSRMAVVPFPVQFGDCRFCTQGSASASWESYSPPDTRPPVESSYDPTTARVVMRRIGRGAVSASVGEDVGLGSGSEEEESEGVGSEGVGDRRVYGAVWRQNTGFGKSKKGKSRAVWVCEVCGNEDGQWWGTCRACDRVGTMKRFSIEEGGGGGGGGNGSRVGFEVSENAVKAWLPKDRAGEVRPLKLKDVNRGLNGMQWRIPL